MTLNAINARNATSVLALVAETGQNKQPTKRHKRHHLIGGANGANCFAFPFVLLWRFKPLFYLINARIGFNELAGLVGFISVPSQAVRCTRENTQRQQWL